MRPSNESNSRQIALAEQQGDAFGAAVDEMTQHEAHGREMRVGDYRVGIAVEQAEGLYQFRDGALEWIDPTHENAHIEVEIRSADDGRFVPGLTVHATIIAADGSYAGTHRQPFLWHPWLYHYGRNWTLPGSGTYTIRVHIDPADFPRHDKTNGARFVKHTDVEFADVMIQTGQKRS